MDTAIETLIDGRPFAWRAEGEFAWGEGPALCRLDRDPLLPGLGALGFRVVDLPAGCADELADRTAALLGCARAELAESYHRQVDEAGHLATIEKTRELRFRDLAIAPQPMIEGFAAALGVRLSPNVPVLGHDHVILRLNRPGSSDYNPPHRDGALAIWANTLNVWIPITGVDGRTSLPVVPGSHRIAESECWQTEPGGAAIGGRPYRVPAIAWLRAGPLQMVRAAVSFGQALLFTPYLIHGLAVNRSDHTRIALELRLGVTGS